MEFIKANMPVTFYQISTKALRRIPSSIMSKVDPVRKNAVILLTYTGEKAVAGNSPCNVQIKTEQSFGDIMH